MCGGEGCNGTTSTSLAALNAARNVSDGLKAAGKELQGVSKKVLTASESGSSEAGDICLSVTQRVVCVQLQDIAALTRDVKNQAMTALEKAQKKKAYFEKNNKNLKDFIKTIKDFLTGLSVVVVVVQVELYS